MSNSTRLALPFIDAAQSQKHVTHNEALVALDALVHLSVKSRNVATPPASPTEGDRYLAPTGATGVFAGHANAVAAFDDGGWAFLAPRAGWRVYVESENLFLVFDGAVWKDAGLALQNLQNLSRVGIGATADAANPLLAKLNGALLTARASGEGGTGDLRLVLNKSVASATASQLYQTNYSGRAEIGLTGDDRLRIKVSADGSIWKEAFGVDPSTGQPSFPLGIAAGEALGFRNRLRNAQFQINQRAISGVVNLAAGQYGHDGVRGGAAGATYTFATNGADTTLTITAGSLVMPIDAPLVEGGVYTLSQAGAAQARVWQGAGYTGSGAYAAAPFQTIALAATTQTNVEFSTGTVLRPQLEPGPVATIFERRRNSIELFICQRYFWRSGGTQAWQVHAIGGLLAANSKFLMNLPAPMRATPSLTVNNVGSFRVVDTSNTNYTPSAITLNTPPSVGSTACEIYATISGGVAGRPCELQSNNAPNATLDFSAEL